MQQKSELVFSVLPLLLQRPYPRKGNATCSASASLLFCSILLQRPYPRKGNATLKPLFTLSVCELAATLSPQGECNTKIFPSFSFFSTLAATLSPQGECNISFVYVTLMTQSCSDLIPARGMQPVAALFFVMRVSLVSCSDLIPARGMQHFPKPL